MPTIPQDIRYAMPNPNNKDNPQSFYGSIQNLSNSKGFLTGNGPPAEPLSAEQVYLDTLSGDWYRLENGVNQSFFSNSAGQTGGVTYTSGDGITVFQDDPSPGFATVNMNQSILTVGATGEIPYASPANDGAAVVVRKITNNDGSLTVSSDVSNAISIDNNTLIDAVQAVGLPAYSEINRKVGNTHEVQRLGSGSNIAITSDFINGCLIETQPNVSHNSVEITTGGSPANPALNIQATPTRSCGIHHSQPGGFSRINFGVDGQTTFWQNISNFVTEFTGGSNWVNTVSAVTNLGSGAQLFNNIFLQNAPVIGSDSRIKHDVQDLMAGMGLSFVKNLRPVSYVYNDTVTITEDGTEHRVPHSRRHLGFIAQEIKSNLAGHGCDTSQCDIIDNDIMVDPEGLDQWRLRTDSIVPCLVKAIQQLEARVAVLESK